MRARSNSNADQYVAHADPDSPAYSERVAVPVMRAVDQMPPAYRDLVNEFGYVDVYRAWKRGWSVERIRADADDGKFVL